MARSPRRSKKPKVLGLDGATAMLGELAFLTGSNIGAEFLADQPRRKTIQSREKGTIKAGDVPTHAEVLKHLDSGGRSLYPSEEDAQKAGQMIRDSIAKHLKRTGETVTNKAGVSRVLKADKQALAGAASGLRKGTKYMGRRMLARIKARKTTSGAAAKEVTIPYAIWREDNYSVNESVVYIASGQLVNAIASGKVKIFLKNANIGELLKNI